MDFLEQKEFGLEESLGKGQYRSESSEFFPLNRVMQAIASIQSEEERRGPQKLVERWLRKVRGERQGKVWLPVPVRE